MAESRERTAPRDHAGAGHGRRHGCWRWKAALALLGVLMIIACSAAKTSYRVAKGTVRGTCKVAGFAIDLAGGTLKTTYRLGKFTYKVIMAPRNWPLTHDIKDIGGLSPKEAIRLGKVKNSPYTVKGHRYYPMSVSEARHYRQEGIASWYGYETWKQPGGRMTANGEVFDPCLPSAAHKLLPLPIHVRVTNLENGRSLIVRVNDRGPFVPGRIIDLSAEASKKLGFYRRGTARVRVETVELD